MIVASAWASMSPDVVARARAFEARCVQVGLDLVHPFRLDAYHAVAAPADRLHDFGRPRALALIVANTRAFWAPFLAAVQADAALAADAHPLDAYVIANVNAAVACMQARAHVHFAHEMTPRPIPIQRIADAAGFATLSPCHLSVHPVFGPWIGLRAVVVVDVDGPEAPPRAAPDRCAACARPCVAALDEALAAAGRDTPLARAISDDWRRWARIREACPEGREHRYGEDQITYHYAKDRTRLAPRSDE
jgi:methylmalonic aciduria homocystinuria type C protein